MKFFEPIWATLTTAAVGAASWIYVAEVGNRREAWDNPIFFTMLMPAVAGIAAIVSFFVPEKPWRWAMIPFGAQALIAFLQNPGANLLPLGLVMFAILGGICSIPAAVGAAIGRMVKR
jgi:hypothetical protein